MELIEQWLNRIILTRWQDPTKKQTKQNKRDNDRKLRRHHHRADNKVIMKPISLQPT